MNQIEYFQNKIIQTALKAAKEKKCNKCYKSDKWNVVPLYEHSPYIPSQIVFYCTRCSYHEPYMWEKNNNAKKFGEAIQKELDRRGLDQLVEDTKKKLTNK
jgi:hypothetical protein